jgi:hypothetical protein
VEAVVVQMKMAVLVVLVVVQMKVMMPGEDIPAFPGNQGQHRRLVE